MREEERIREGLLFCPADPELKRMKLRTHNLNLDYNKTYEHETEKRAALLRQMLGEMGEGVVIQGPVWLHYGVHTKIGRKFFGNFNLTIQDDAEVTIGNNCDFGPNVTIVTPVHPMLAEERRTMIAADGEERHLCYAKPRDYRKRRVDGCERRGVPRRYHWGRLRHRRGQRRDPLHPAAHVCRRKSLPRDSRNY